MPTFPAKKFRSNDAQGYIGAWYRRQLVKNPFLVFGLPFMVAMVAGSFILTPATAIRYERHDRKVQQVKQDEALGLKQDRRRVDIQEDYYRLAAKVCSYLGLHKLCAL